MSDKFFLDTNIFVYSFDNSAKYKAKRAKDLISSALETGKSCISYQVVQEFLNVALRKFEKPLSNDDCKAYLKEVLSPLFEIYPDVHLFEVGLNIQSQTGYSFYDSMIIAAAHKGNCKTLYSEDLHDGHNVYGVTIVDPFKG